MKRVFLSVLAGLAICSAAGSAAAEEIVLKFGTLAPAESPWGKVFKIWQKALNKKTNGQVEVQFFWNGQQGDEASMIKKIRSGQLDGAAITGTGLAHIYKQVLVLQLPGMFDNWEKLDKARDRLKPRFDEAFEKEGFKNLGWGDVGAAHVMTKGFEIRRPEDLRKRNVYMIKGDPILGMLYSTVGEITPKEITIPEITPGLTSGSINVVISPALAAEQLQWAPQLDHINEMVTGYSIGALVFSSAKFKLLPPDVQTALSETGKIAANALTTSIRKADDEAFARLKQRMKSYTLTSAEHDRWKPIFKQVRESLKGGTFKAEEMQAVEEAAK